MRNLYSILLILIALTSLGQSVPDTRTFLQRNVTAVVGGGSLQESMSSTYNLSESFWDVSYKGSKDRLSNFRKYTIGSSYPCTSKFHFDRAIMTQSPVMDYTVDFGTTAGLYMLTYQGYITGDKFEIYQNGIYKDGTGSAVSDGSGNYRSSWSDALNKRPVRFIYDPVNGRYGTIRVTPNSDAANKFSWISYCPIVSTYATTYNFTDNASLYYTGLIPNIQYVLQLSTSPSTPMTVTVMDASGPLGPPAIPLLDASASPNTYFNNGSGTSVVIDLIKNYAGGVLCNTSCRLLRVFTAPNVRADAYTNLTRTSVTLNATNIEFGGTPFLGKGFVYSSDINNTLTLATGTKVDLGAGTVANWSSNITGLTPNVVYYYKAWAQNSDGVGYSSKYQVTMPAYAPTVAYVSYSYPTSNTGAVLLTGDVTDDGGVSVTSRGTAWADVDPAFNTNQKVSSGTGGTGQFSATITQNSYAKIYLRSYATNSIGTSYGSLLTLETTTSTSDASAIASYSATLGGQTSNLANLQVTSVGVIYSSSNSNPQSGSGTEVQIGTAPGNFGTTVSSLASSTLYYYRSYAKILSSWYIYGPVKTFTTTSAVTTPTLASVSAYQGSGCNFADLSSSVTSDGGATITERGFVYSSSYDPPSIGTGTSLTVSGTTGSMSATATLFAGTTYYVRSYAKNSAGTAYSPNTATYYRTIVLPTLASTSLSSVSYNSASLSSNVTDNGCGTLSAVGICYVLGTGTPTTGNSTASSYPSTGPFTVTTGTLSASSTYTARSYATNVAGTNYGSNFQFTTPAAPKNVTASYTVQTTTPTTVIVTWFVNIPAGATSSTSIPINITNASGSGTTLYNVPFSTNQTVASPTTITYNRLSGSSYVAYGTLGTMPTGYVNAGDASTTIPAR